jgi:anti-anti-sigma factor
MATPLMVSTGRDDEGMVVVSATGELDMSNVDVFTAAIVDGLSAASQDGGLLTIDLTGVQYLDSGAINALFGHADQIRLMVNPILMPVLTVSGLTGVASVEAAAPPSDH